jgi:hypothetical protein
VEVVLIIMVAHLVEMFLFRRALTVVDIPMLALMYL